MGAASLRFYEPARLGECPVISSGTFDVAPRPRVKFPGRLIDPYRPAG